MILELGKPGQFCGIILNTNNKGIAYEMYGKVGLMIWLWRFMIIWCTKYGFKYMVTETPNENEVVDFDKEKYNV